MKLLNHPHIIKLYQVRTQFAFLCDFWQVLSVFMSNNLSLQFLDAAPVLLGVCESRGVGCIR